MANVMKVALATGNNGKLAEFDGYLRTLRMEMFQGPKLKFPPEVGDDYLRNAIGKAQHGAKEWGVVCVGEDSGIEVAGLNNLPGPFSARFAHFDWRVIEEGIRRRTLAGSAFSGPDGNADDKANNQLILDLLRGKTGVDRYARYVACIAVADPSGKVLYVTHASVDGFILDAPRGDKGFGFDPIMEFFNFPGRSVAELTMDEKNLVSHRGRAIQNLMAWLARAYA